MKIQCRPPTRIDRGSIDLLITRFELAEHAALAAFLFSSVRTSSFTWELLKLRKLAKLSSIRESTLGTTCLGVSGRRQPPPEHLTRIRVSPSLSLLYQKHRLSWLLPSQIKSTKIRRITLYFTVSIQGQSLI